MEKVITSSPYICAPNILDHPDRVVKQVELDMSGADCIKAGSPISADGKVANDATAIGILLNDCHACIGAHRGLVVIEGRIKQDVAAEHSGIAISDEAKSALVNISFTGDGARMGGAGGGVTSWNDLTDKPFYDEPTLLYEGYPEYMFGTARLPFVLKAGVGYLAGPVDGNVWSRPGGALTATVDSWGVVHIEHTDSIHGFELSYSPVDGYTAFTPYGSVFHENRTEPSDDGTDSCVSTVKFRIEYASDEDVGVIPINAKYLPKAAAVADVTAAPTAEDFNALLASLREAGYLAT